MSYYDTVNKKIITDKEINKKGLTKESLDILKIYPIKDEIPSYDGRYYYISKKDVVLKNNEYVMEYEIKLLPLAFLKTAKKEDITQIRWEHESSGITVNGTTISTGVDDQNRISSAIQGMSLSDLTEIDFKAESGWVKLNVDELKGIASLITTYVQLCFTHEKELYEKIDSVNTQEEVMNIDITSGWPNKEFNTL